MSRPAEPDDVDAICAELPETELGTSWGMPAWKVPTGGTGKAFLRRRAPSRDAVDPASGEPYADLLVIDVADAGVKEAMVTGSGPFFTIDHFLNYDSVLVSTARLGELEVDELREIIVESWAKRAPKRLVKAFFADQDPA